MRKNTLQRVGSDNPVTRAIVVAGAPRSGTTILARHIAEREDVFRLHAVRGVRKRVRKYLVRCGLANAAGPFWANMRLDMTRTEFHELLERHATPVYETDRACLIKRIAAVNYLPFLANQFTLPVLVHLVRDPYDNVSSILSRREKVHGSRQSWWGVTPQGMPEKTGDPVRDCALQYRCTHELIRQSRGLYARYIPVSYEAYCNDPRRVIHNITQAAELSGEVPLPPEEIRFRGGAVSEDVRATVDKIIGDDFVTRMLDEER